MRTSRAIAGLALVAAALAAGCGPSVVSKGGTVDTSDVNLAAIGRIYTRAQQQLGRPPRAAADLKPYAKGEVDLDQILTSPNDHQPYVIVWGANMLSTPDPYVVLVYE